MTWKIARIVWAISIISAATALGIAIGWHNHGFGGAIGLGIVGFWAGVFLSDPYFFLTILS